MSNSTSLSLGDVTQQLDRYEPVLPDVEYQLLGMRSKIGGPFVRETKKGSEISAKKLNRVNAGDFIYSRLFAWQGSFALIPEAMDSCYVSNEFPIFSLDDSRIDPKFLVYWFGLPHIQKIVEADCTGSTPGTRNRYKEKYFAALTLNVPPIKKQHQIVAKIESLAAKINEAKSLRQAIQSAMDALIVAMAHRNDLSDDEKGARRWKRVVLREILTQAFNPIDVEPGKDYRHFGIYSFARGLFEKAPLAGDVIKASKLYRASEGQFIYGRLNAYEGAFAVINENFDKCHVSNEFPMFDCDSDRVLPEFLLAYFSTPAVWEALKRKVTGIGGGAGNRRIRLKESVLLSEKIWLPPTDWQRNIKKTAEKINAFKEDRDLVRLRLDGLLPSILDRAFKDEL